MLRSVGSLPWFSFWRTAAAGGFGGRRIALGGRAASCRTRNASNFASGTTKTALRSWKGQQYRQSYQKTRTTTALTTTTTTTTIRSLPYRLEIVGGTQRQSFFSDQNSNYSPPTQQGQQQLLGTPSSSSKFSPLGDFLMDAIAWTVALSMWYIPNMMEFDDDDTLGEDNNKNCERDNADDRHLEYREDYGPSMSQWPSTPSTESRRNRNNPKTTKEEKRKEE